MARFSYSGVAITGGTGRLNSGFGGSVLLKNGVVRNYVTPVNPQTDDQQVTRTAFAYLTTAWKGLTPTQQAAWVAAWGSGDWTVQDPFTGTTRPYGSAKSLFIALNMNFLISGNALNTPSYEFATPPATSDLPALGVTSVAMDASAGTVAIAYSGTLGDSVLVIRMTPPLSPGNQRLTSVKTKLRSLPATSSATPLAEGAAYVAKFGAITTSADLAVFYVIEQIDTTNGKRGLVGTGRVVIVA